MLVALSSTSYCARRSLSEGQGSRNFKSKCAASAATIPRNIVARWGPLSLSFVSTCLQCHLLCWRSLSSLFFLFLLLVAYVTVCCQSRLCTHLFPLSELSVHLCLAAGWSLVVISLSHCLVVPLVDVCCQSGLCTHLSLLSELGVRLCLTVGLSFVAFSSSTHFLVSTSALDGLLFDFDIQGQVH